MKKSTIVILIFCFAILSFNTSAFTWWKNIKTEHFTVFYPEKLEELAKEILITLEYYRPQVEKLTGGVCFNLPIVLDDFGMNSNGFADPVFKQSHLFWYPPKDMGALENWATMVAIHEYTHILQMTNRSGITDLVCQIFGNVFNPNCIVPGWLCEGITVYSESNFSEYQGRLNDGAYDAYIMARAKARDLYSCQEVSLALDEFQLDGIYTFGGVFFRYLAESYGEEKLAEFFTVNGSNFAGLEASAQKVFGKTLTEIWTDWLIYEEERGQEYQNLGQEITSEAPNKLSGLLVTDSHGSKLYYQKTRASKVDVGKYFYYYEIIEIDLENLEEKVLLTSISPFNLELKKQGQKLYYGVYEQKKGYDNTINLGFGYISLLRSLDLVSGKKEDIWAGEIRAYDFLDENNLLFASAKRSSFGCDLYLKEGTNEPEFLYSLACLVDEILVDGEEIFLVASKYNKNTSLYRLHLKEGRLEALVDTPYLEAGLKKNGDLLFFHANYEQKYSIYSYDLKNAELYRLTDNGYARGPHYDAEENMLYYTALDTGGYSIYRLAADFQRYQRPQLAEKKPVDIFANPPDYRQGTYWENIKSLQARVFLPYFNYENAKGSSLGVLLLGRDALNQVPQYIATLTYDFSAGRLISSLDTGLNIIPSTAITLGYNNILENSFYLDLDYKVINRLNAGLTDFSLGNTFNYKSKEGLEIVPHWALALRYPGWKIQLGLKVPWETHNLVTKKERLGLYLDLQLEKDLALGGLKVKGEALYDPAKSTPASLDIRGYKELAQTEAGVLVSLEYSRPLAKIDKRYSSASFGIACKELWINGFLDVAYLRNGKNCFSCGLEFYPDLTLAFSYAALELAPGLGLGINGLGKPFIHFLFKGSL